MVPFLGGLYGRSNLPAEPKEFSKTTTKLEASQKPLNETTAFLEQNDRFFSLLTFFVLKGVA